MKRASKLFVDAYLAAALWTSTDSDGNPLDAEYDGDAFTREARRQAQRDCNAFVTMAGDLMLSCSPDDAQHGHDFWLTRNRHGCGFWDRGYGEPGERLSEMARTFGDAYVLAQHNRRLSWL